jgi:hypothetical protein
MWFKGNGLRLDVHFYLSVGLVMLCCDMGMILSNRPKETEFNTGDSCLAVFLTTMTERSQT